MSLQLAHLEAAMTAADSHVGSAQNYAVRGQLGSAWDESVIPGYTPGGARGGSAHFNQFDVRSASPHQFNASYNGSLAGGGHDVLPLRALERTPVVGMQQQGLAGSWVVSKTGVVVPGETLALSTPATLVPIAGEAAMARSADFLQAVVKGQSHHLHNLQSEHAALQSDFTLVHGSATHNAVLVQSLQTELKEKSTQVEALRQENAVLANRIQELEYAGMKSGCCTIM